MDGPPRWIDRANNETAYELIAGHRAARESLTVRRIEALGRGIDNWGLSMGRQRLGLLHLRNLPLFLQNLPMPHLPSETKKLDIVALDLIRDRELLKKNGENSKRMRNRSMILSFPFI